MNINFCLIDIYIKRTFILILSKLNYIPYKNKYFSFSTRIKQALKN